MLTLVLGEVDVARVNPYRFGQGQPPVHSAWFRPRRPTAITQFRGRYEVSHLPGGRRPPGPGYVGRGMGDDMRRGKKRDLCNLYSSRVSAHIAASTRLSPSIVLASVSKFHCLGFAPFANYLSTFRRSLPLQNIAYLTSKKYRSLGLSRTRLKWDGPGPTPPSAGLLPDQTTRPRHGRRSHV